jgi:RNA polymerase sigma-70 factor (ECF subfamily)
LDPEEVSLLSRLQAGEEAAFKILFDRYYPALCVYARRLLGDLDKAREVVQGVFVKLYEHREKLPPITSLKSYLYRSVHNNCLNQVKQTQIYQSHHQQIYGLTPLVEEADELVRLELEEKIWQVVQGLPGQCRKIFQMNRFEDKKNQQIADELGLSIRTVETQISKALKILRRELADFLLLLLLLTTALFI